MTTNLIIEPVGIKIHLPSEVQEIFSVIKEYGAEAFVVGGCVRDSILGRPVHDYDICTPVPVSELQTVFEEKGYHVIPTGIKHGTITVMINGQGYEITTYRKDGDYSDGRHPDNVEFTSDLIEDLSRRDFTINAMAYNPETGLVDPFGGFQDIYNHIIRCVGDPCLRFNEDGLRIMRGVRFSAQLGFRIDVNTRQAINDLKDNLGNISAERINSELVKIITSHHPFVIMNYPGVLFKIIPEFCELWAFDLDEPDECYSAYGHTRTALCFTDLKDLVVRLAILFHDIGKPYCYSIDEFELKHYDGHEKIGADLTDKIMRRLKFDNKTREQVVELVLYHNIELKSDKYYIKTLLNALGVQQFKRLIKLQSSIIQAQADLYKAEKLEHLKNVKDIFDEILVNQECFTLQDLAIHGDDIKKYMYIKEGKDIGHWLDMILNQVMYGNLSNNRDELIAYMIGISDGWIKI